MENQSDLGKKGEEMKLKIGGHAFEVKFVEGMGVQVGVAVHNDNVIKVASNVAHSQKEATLLHEIIHIVADNLGLLDLPEQSVSVLSGGLYQVLKDNYDLDLLNIKNNKKEE